MKKFIRNIVVTTAFLMASIPTVNAASISALISSNTLAINDTAQISFFLNMLPGETASVFEGVFNLNGLGTVASASLNSGGPSWPSAFGNIVGDQALLSLTSSNNDASSRLLGTMDIFGLSVGTFDVIFNDATFAAFDINVNPFIQDLALNNVNGQLLATTTVVPVPAALVLFLSGISGLMMISRRRVMRR